MTGQPVDRSSDCSSDRSRVRRTTLVLTLVALAFYVGFILIGVVNAQG